MGSARHMQFDMDAIRRMEAAPMFNPAQMPGPPTAMRGNLNIDMQMPAGVEERIRQLQKMRGAAPRLHQIDPAPGDLPPPPQAPLRSVLRRDP